MTCTIRLLRRLLPACCWMAWVASRSALAADVAPAQFGPDLQNDPVLSALVVDALDKRPELARAKALLLAERERVPQAGALADPTISVGIQNDGFRAIEIGQMETSWVSIMATQTFPWFGKLGLRSEVAGFDVRTAEADLARLELSIRAEVERGYVDLLLARDELGLLAKLEALWAQSEGLARVRYESGEAAQSDLLRAQLERIRLRQRRYVLESEERRRVEVLNRLRGHALDEPIPTSRSLADVPDPELIPVATAIADAETRSPELLKARLAGEQSARQVDLARKDYFPDLTLTAGLMPRGGQFETMWLAGLSFTLPVWAGSKQSRAVAENEARRKGAADGVEVVNRLLRQRVEERLTLLGALLEANRLYRSGLLVQSDATVSSTLAQYQVGRVTFASVLEALTGYLSDVTGFLESVASTQQIAIAQREVSLDLVPGPAAGGVTATPMPGAGAMSGGTSASQGPAAAPAGEGGSSSMKGM